MSTAGRAKLRDYTMLVMFFVFFSRIDEKKTEAASYDVRQPSFITEDGHLVVVSGSDRNITLKTSGSGYVNINGDNLINLVKLARNASETVERFRLTKLVEMENTLKRLSNMMFGSSGLMRRVAYLEAGGGNGSVDNGGGGRVRPNRGPNVQLRTRVNTLTRRVFTLERQVRELRTLLTANECASNPCRNGGSCEDHFNGFVCRCPANWEGPLCETDVNECAHFAGTDLGCQNGATCINKPGTYECVCVPGWFGLHCTQRSNDCSSASSRDLCGHGVCVSQAGTAGYTCICEQGWTTEGTNKGCTKDVDECSSNNPPCSRNPMVQCVNVPGSFFCSGCPQGFTGNGFYCTDINECQTDNGGCSPLVQCVNTYGSRVCSVCPPGYQGDGVTCNYAGSACRTNNGGCHALATCQDNAAVSSSFVTCTCPAGYAGIGLGPSGCYPDPGGSSTPLNPCLSNPCVRGMCMRLGRFGFWCRCPPGFSGPTCSSVNDPCSPNPCQNGGSCVRRPSIIGPPDRSPFASGFVCNCTTGFSGATCGNQNQGCGGVLTDNAGSIQFPTSTGKYEHSRSCAWLITVNTSMIVNVTFKSFALEESPDCLFDWVQIHDGRSAGDQLIGRYCGNALPKNGRVVSTTNALYLWFRSDRTSNHDGFQLDWEASTPVCGGAIEATTHGRLSSPGSPGKYPPNRDCLWTVTGPLNKRLQFHFYTLMIASSTNCSQDWLEIHDGIEPTDPSLVKFCNSSHPAPLTTPGHSALIHFHSDDAGSDTGFQLMYSVVEGFPGCGGVLTGPVGDILSPRDPSESGYKKSLDCEWKIQLGPSERIALSFESFDLERSTNCNFDFLELREGADENAPLVGRYCGSTSPRTHTSLSNVLHIKFHTDWSLGGDGFHIKYKTMCGGTYETSEGIIKSPLYPNPYPNSRTCEYIIKQPLGKAIKLHFLDFDVEDTSYPNCFFDNVQVRDGDNENSTLVGTYCGEDESLLPPDVVSTHNYLWLQFNTDASDRNRGFMANYSTIDVRCGGILKEPMGLITSPSHPENYPHDIVCRWVIVAKPGYVIQLQFVTVSLEYHPTCKRDYVEVFDNSSLPNGGGSMGRFCSGSPPALTSSDTTMSIVFATDSSIAREGFTASYFSVDASKMCGGTFFTTAGVVKSPNYPDDYPHDKLCTWVITVPQGQQIMLNVTDFEMETHTDCRFDYLEIRNGAYETSPLIGQFCGETIPRRIPSLSNQMFLRFKSDGSKSAKGFQIMWDGTSTGCGGTLTAPTGSIMSPNYPQPYGRNAECFWKIAVNQGSRIQVVFNDIDLEAHSKCRMDYIELYEGLDSSGELLGRYCTTHPITVTTKGNHLYIKFRSDVSQEGRGFHIKYDAVCTATLTGYRGVIESPNFPRPYPADRDCTWTVSAPLGNKVNLTFSHFDMENDTTVSSPSESERQDARGCKFDYVEVTEGKQEEAPNTVLGRFCGTNLPPRLFSTKDHVYIHFVSDASVADNGFRIEWVINGCGGQLTHPTGEFTSPGYPGAYPVSVECEWHIVLEPDRSVQLAIGDLALERSRSTECGYDRLTVYGGPDDTSPKLGTYCHNLANISLTSSGNSMFVRFVSDFSFSGRGFKATYSSVPSRCGGKFSAPSGSIHSRNYPQNYDPYDDCEWLIEVDENHVVRLTFTSFDVEAHRNCSMDYVRVFDGASLTSPKLIDHCGNVLPTPAEVVSTGNKLLVRFKSDGSVGAKGFMANYSIACGARIVTDSSGIINLVDAISVYTNLEHNSNCSWIIVGSKPDDRVTLTITHLDVSPSDGDEECEYYHVDIHDGEDVDGPLMGSYCGNKAPPHITSRGNAMFVHLVTEYGAHYGHFTASYSVFASACGGDLTSEHGSFATPNFPDNYPPNAECIWTINASPGNRAIISFASFDIEASEFCNDDYVEVREVNAIGPIIGVYCTTIPGNVTAANKLWVKFKSNGAGNGKGFVADYTLLHGNEVTGLRGQIASPLYPKPYIQSGEFHWRITTKFGYAVSITFQNFYMDKMGNTCTYYLAIYDGYDDTAPELAKLCGINHMPDPITSTSNVVYLSLTTDPMKQGTLFLLDWIQVDKPIAGAKTGNTNASGCDAIVDLTDKNMSLPYRLTSPGFPGGYKGSMDCEWIFETSPGSHVELMFTTLDIEQSATCNMDYVQVFKGRKNQPDWRPIKTFCLPNATMERKISGSSLMKVRFHTDSLKNESGFAANVYSLCGGLLTASTGAIEVTNETMTSHPRVQTRLLNCEWNITVRTGRKIAVTFTRFGLSRTSEAGCSSGTGNVYLMLKNGHGDDSPLLGNGKYCGRDLPNVPETTSNKLFVKLQSFRGNQGFRMEYQEVSQTCGGNVMLTQVGGPPQSVTISSPNYPNIPQPHVECSWVVMAPAGERLHIDFPYRFDISPSPRCQQAGVEVRDGGTQSSHLLGGPFCNEAPSSIYSTGNILYVRYFTDVSDPKDGFQANISLATCGGSIRDYKGVVTSPNSPGPYPMNTDCEWRIIGPEGSYLTLQLQQMDFYRGSSNCSAGDYISIDEVIPGNNSETFRNNLGVYCNLLEPNATLQTSSNEAVVSFHSIKRTGLSRFNGFKLFFNATRSACGGELSTPNGVFETPASNRGYFTRFCLWKITVPPGRRITVKLLDFDLEPTSVGTYNQQLQFFNDHEYKSRIVAYNSTSIPLPVKSSTNKMLVHLWIRRNTGHRGFKASYSSDEPSICVGDFNSSSGVIVSPTMPNNTKTFFCEWENVRSAAVSNQTLAVTLVNGTVSNRDVKCEQASAGLWHGSVTFALTYKMSPCGGQLTGPLETITSPGFPANYPPDMDCAWSVEFPPGQSIKIHFNTFDVEGPCDKDYVVIHNGASPKSPIIGKYCGSNVPADIKSQSNVLWIDFHSDSSANQKTGFDLTLEPVVFGCGGIFHGKLGELSSPGFPATYSDNAECEWEIRVDNGYTIQLEFIKIFHLETSTDCVNDFVEVYDYPPGADDWKKMGRYCGRAVPDMQNSTGSQLKVLFRSNQATVSDGFKARWKTTCGGIITGQSSGRIISPGYPNAYSGKLRCNYTILAPGREIITRFTTFTLEGEYSSVCHYDNLTIHGLQNYWSREITPLGTYCGNNMPPARTFKDKVTLDFRTDWYVERKGFVMEFEVSSCGSEMTAPGVIETTKGATVIMGSINCTWTITAPPNNVIVLRFTNLELEHSYRCHYDSVSVYEGALVNESALVGQFCGNLSTKPPVAKSTTNRMVVSLTMMHQRENFRIRADVLFTYGEKAGCGGKISVGASPTTLRSPDVNNDGKYEPFLDCHWLLTGADSQTVSLQLTSLSVAPCFNKTFNATTGCACDYLEIRDGTSQFAELIGKYCGEKPTGPIVASSNKMWVRFASDGVNEAPGFTATVTSTPSICGELVLNVTNDTQVLTSPNWPNNYPPNMRCRWRLTSSRNVRIAAHFEEIKLDDADDCADRITFMDVGDSMIIAEGTGADDVRYAGQPNRPISIFRGSRSPTSAVHFCGSPKQMDYYSESNNVAVTFTSNQERAAKGFKLRYSVAGCTRNYTAVQGRIVVERLPEHCYILITAAANHTISLYFTSFQVFSSRECDTRALQVHDGDNSDAPSLAKICGYELPSPIHSTGNKMYLHSWRPQSMSFEHIDVTYTTTDKGRGCGGQIFNYGGTFSSPFYPNNIRNASVCRWDISVPYGTTPSLKFVVFDLGPKSTCETDFVELLDVDTATGVEYVRTRYCGQDEPAVFTSEMGTVAVRYTRSVHNGGTGWLIRFMGRIPGSAMSNY